MEIRVKVEEYVNQKILALRQNHPGSYDNVSILRMNAMKFLPNFFEKHQVGIQGNGFGKIWIVDNLETALANRISFQSGMNDSCQRCSSCSQTLTSRRESTRPASSRMSIEELNQIALVAMDSHLPALCFSRCQYG